MRRTIIVSTTVLFGLLCFPGQAGAYLDPGSGSLLFQFLIAGVLGAGVALRIFWGRIVQIFTGKKSDSKPTRNNGR